MRPKRQIKYSAQQRNILSSQEHMVHSPEQTDHMLGHKTSLNKFKNNEIIRSIFSDYNRIK